MKCKVKMIYKNGMLDVPDKEEFTFNVDEFEINENADFILRTNGKITKVFSIELFESIIVTEVKVTLKATLIDTAIEKLIAEMEEEEKE